MKKSTSPEAYLRRTVRLTAITGVFVALAIAARWGSTEGFGFAVGLVWGIGNFIALAMMVRSKLSPTAPRRSGMKVALVVAFKIGMYGAALALLATGWVPPAAFAAGFTWLLAVILLRALGQWWVDRNAIPGTGHDGPGPATANEDVQKR